MRIRTYLVVAMASLALAGCTVLRVQNVTNTTVWLRADLPDRGQPVTKSISAGEVAEFYSETGGRYTIQVMPSARYESLLKDLRSQISGRLFNEGATLSADDVAWLTDRLNEVDQAIEQLAEPGARCSGALPENEASTAVVTYDATADRYALSCN